MGYRAVHPLLVLGWRPSLTPKECEKIIDFAESCHFRDLVRLRVVDLCYVDIRDASLCEAISGGN